MDTKDLVKLPKTELIAEIPLNEQEIKLSEYLSLGYRPSDIAELLGMSTAWVRMHRRDPRVIKIVHDMQEESLDCAKKAIINNTTRAAATVIELLGELDPRVRLSAANTILDRAGLVKPDKDHPPGTVNIVNFNNMTAEELKINILQRFKALELED